MGRLSWTNLRKVVSERWCFSDEIAALAAAARNDRRGWTSVLVLLLVAVQLAACGGEEERTLFERLPPERTGVAFANTLQESPRFNILNYLYYYNGGGVAVGDVNGDDLPDLYFTANEGLNKLYLNQGDFRFDDVTAEGGVAGTVNWTTGVTMADVNGDGRLDIYVSAVGGYLDRHGRNELFMNQGPGADGVPTFAERAADYGLDFQGFSTHATFFDYDLDGDLDVYLLNHTTHYEGTYGDTSLRDERHARAGDRLLRNEGGRFVDVSQEAGIYSGVTGYGLSVTVTDVNVDGWPDLYVANDFHENDFLYLNQGDGTFAESIEAAMGHTSRFSMGSDAADIDNDGRPDLVVLDMLPQREDILKTSAGAESFEIYNLKRRLGYGPQFARNTLQLNRGVPGLGQAPRFSDVGYFAGMQATDWSWSPLLADFDLDGRRDLFVSNGIYRRPNDLDYINYVANEAVQRSLQQGITEENLTLLEKMPQIPLANYAFRGSDSLVFTDRAEAWGLADEGFSNGAAYGDLDNDGDLDLVVNNINAPASIYENHADSLLPERHGLTIRFEGEGSNTAGIGAKVLLYGAGPVRYAEQMPTRGFQSSVDPRMHLGLGTATSVDSLVVVWPDGRYQTLPDVQADQILTLRQAEASGTYAFPQASPGNRLFEDVTGQLALDFRHDENTFVDFNLEKLMPHMLSTEGPALAVADVNGDGLEDFYVGGAEKQASRLFVQTPEGDFEPTSERVWQADSLHEDVDAAFFDADGDGDQDLYVVSVGNGYWETAEALLDRLYFNDGSGQFERKRDALPDVRTNGSTVAPGDFDGDGDLDLFVGSRLVPKRYGATPPSYLLENDGRGTFKDVTETKAPGLAQAGMVTDAVWADVVGDGRPDLIVVGEWMPVQVFTDQSGRLAEVTDAAGLAQTNGWWNAVHADDFDGDGDADLVLGNLGLNSKIKASPDEPARLYLGDFDGNETPEGILTYYKDGVSYPMASRDDLIGQMEGLRRQYPSYTAFGARQIEDLVSPKALAEADVKEAYTFASAYAENHGDGTFTLRALPTEAQFGPVNALLSGDVDGDGHTDLLLAGGFYGVRPDQGRYDALYGLLLQGDGAGGFTPVDLERSGFVIDGEARDLAWLRRADGARLALVARNNDEVQVIQVRPREEEAVALDSSARLSEVPR